MSNEEKILEMLSAMQQQMNGMQQQIGDLQRQVDRVEEKVDDLSESHEGTREAVNSILAWTDTVSRAVKVPRI